MSLLLMPVAVMVMLRTATVQTYLAHQASIILSKQLKTKVVVGNFRLNWFLEAVVSDVEVLDRHQKAILKAKKIIADVRSIDFNSHTFTLNKVLLSQGDINIIYYKADSSLNLQFIIDGFSSSGPADTTPSKPWILRCKNVSLQETHFLYRDETDMSPGKGIDYSDLDLSKLNLELNDILIHGDTVQTNIKQLTCKEKSGFRLDDFSTKVLVCPRGLKANNLQIATAKSRLNMDLSFQYNSWNAYNHFIDSVRFTAKVRPSELDMRDVVSFASDLDGMENVINFSGNVKGTIASLSAKDFNFSFGKQTSFKGDVVMNGLPDIEETFFNLKIDQFISSTADVKLFTLPYSEGMNTIPIPKEVDRFGNININGRFTGFYNDFLSKATFHTDAGQFTTDILLSNDKSTHTVSYDGKLLVEGFQAGRVLDLKQLGSLDMVATVKGKNFSLKKADLVMKAEITKLQYENNTIGLITIDGQFNTEKFTGGVYINDPLLGLDFVGSADFSDSLPSFDFHAEVAHANLVRLNLMDSDSVGMLTTSTDFKFKGNNIDNLLGSLSFKNTSFRRGSQTLKVNDLELVTSIIGGGGKSMKLKSDFADATFSGQYTFDDMAEYLTLVFTDFLPSIAKGDTLPERINKGRFGYTVQLHHTDSLTAMFAPWIKISPKTVISGNFDPKLGLVNVNGSSPLVVVEGYAMHDLSLTGTSHNKNLEINMKCSEVNTVEEVKRDTSVLRIEQFSLIASAANDSVKFAVRWDNHHVNVHNRGDIAGAVSFKHSPILSFHLDKADILINDTLWKCLPDNLIVLDSSAISVHNMGFTNMGNHVVLNGIVSKDPLSQLVLDVKGFNISQADILTASLGFDLDGIANGNVNVSELYSVPHVSADLSIAQLGFNHENLGDADIKSYWDNVNNLIGVDMRVVYVGNVGVHYPIKVKGSIYPEREHENFDLSIDVDNLKLHAIEPFLSGVLSRMRGYASGALTMTGDFSDPVLKGSLKLMRSEFLIDYLRTSYSFTGDFNFDKDLMWFKDLELTDSTMSKGSATGYIRHKAFNDWSLDLKVDANKLAALNTPFSPREMFYGTAKATGLMTLKGPIDNLLLKADVTSEKGTDVHIPINFNKSISQNNFIQYKKHGNSDSAMNVAHSEESVLSLQLGLNVTRNAGIGIILPYQMGTIDVKGDGLINMGIDTRGEYSMFGQYVMDNGNFMFNFENILKKNFEIQKGGTLTFNGSPYDADIKLQALVKVKTSLNGLPDIAGLPKSTRLNVNCIIYLSNSLYNPDIRFGISLPDASDEVKRSIFTIIDTTNALEMNQQIISLLVLNTFSSSSGLATSGSTLGLSSYEIVSAQLSRMLSKISKDFDIGVNYRPGDQLSPQQLELALSTQLFNNRVTIDGAVGMNSTTAAAGQTNNTSNQSSQFIGDVQVEVKITDDGRFRAKMFNRTNSTLELNSGYSPYTQGVGVLFRKEFNSISELFKGRKKTKLPNADPTLMR